MDEGGDEGLPCGMGIVGLGGVDETLRVGVCFWPEGADVVAFWAVVLCGVLVLGGYFVVG